MYMFRRHTFSLLFAFATIITVSQPSIASTTYNYNLTADPANVGIYYGSMTVNNVITYPTVDYDFTLTNISTNLTSIPAITLKDGDSIKGTIKLSSTWTIPATNEGEQLNIWLQPINNGGATLFTNDTITFYDNGVPVSPSGLSTLNNTSSTHRGYLIPAISSGFLVPTPSFTFNQIDFSITMNYGQNYSNQVINSVDLGSATPYLAVQTINPVPEAKTYEMLLAGLGMVGFVAQRRDRKASKTNQTEFA